MCRRATQELGRITPPSVEQLILCAWVDPGGRTRRATFSPDQLVLLRGSETLVVRVVSSLSRRWRVVAECC